MVTMRGQKGLTYRSLEEYCLEMAERSLSRWPCPPRAVSKVGRAAVVMMEPKARRKRG